MSQFLFKLNHGLALEIRPLCQVKSSGALPTPNKELKLQDKMSSLMEILLPQIEAVKGAIIASHRARIGKIGLLLQE